MRPVTLAEAEYVAQPFVSFDGQELYPTLLNKAVALFYLVIKNHPFENGNKRMAVVLMLYLLFKNGKFLSVTPEALYDLALIVAGSDTPIEQHLPLIEDAITGFVIDKQV